MLHYAHYSECSNESGPGYSSMSLLQRWLHSACKRMTSCCKYSVISAIWGIIQNLWNNVQQRPLSVCVFLLLILAPDVGKNPYWWYFCFSHVKQRRSKQNLNIFQLFLRIFLSLVTSGITFSLFGLRKIANSWPLMRKKKLTDDLRIFLNGFTYTVSSCQWVLSMFLL